MHIASPPGKVLRPPRVHQVDFQTRLLENVVHRDPVHARGLHGYGPNPAFLQPIGHSSQLPCRAADVLPRLAVPVRWNPSAMGFVPTLNTTHLRLYSL